MKMYQELLAKYEIQESEAIEDQVEKRWFGYSTQLESELLTQIFYKVTGSTSYYVFAGEYKRRKQRGCMCTEFEESEIKFYFEFYRKHLIEELEIFMIAFRSKNNLYPDKSARLYEEPSDSSNMSDEDRRKSKAAGFMSLAMERATPVRMIGEPDENWNN